MVVCMISCDKVARTFSATASKHGAHRAAHVAPRPPKKGNGFGSDARLLVIVFCKTKKAKSQERERLWKDELARQLQQAKQAAAAAEAAARSLPAAEGSFLRCLVDVVFLWEALCC